MQCETYDDLSGFFREGTFEFDPDLSDESTLVFVPPHQHAGETVHGTGISPRASAPALNQLRCSSSWEV